MNWNNYDYSRIAGINEVAIRAELLHSRLRKSNRDVLEVGVGTGDITRVLLDKFDRVICVDSDKRNFKNLEKVIKKEDLRRIEFVNSKIEEVNLSEKYKDIILFGILEHLKNPVRVLKKIYESLDKNGKIYLLVPLANSIHRLLAVKMGMIPNTTSLSESDIQLGHYRVYTPKLFRNHLIKAGLKVIYEQPFYLKPLPTGMLKSLPVEVHRGLDLLGRTYPEFASLIYVEAKK